MGAQGVSALPLLVVEHPLGGERPEAVARRAQQAFEQLNAVVAGSARPAQAEGGLTQKPGAPIVESTDSDPITVADDPLAILEAFTERNWADGLPIVAPTEERVSAMLGGRDGARSLGMMPPLWRQVTLDKLAVNAVMAGCEPRAFPIIVAAVEAMLDRAFNLYGVQATTHPVAPLLVVNGPYGREVGLHSGSGCFGPGFRANATIGRAVRLILLNLGGAWPGRYDMATQASPAKFSFCIPVTDPATLMPQVPSPDDVFVVVAGGSGKHSAVVPNCTFSRAVSREIRVSGD